VHNFCIVDLGSFYLDVLKDRLYTTPKGSLARRSAQTAMYHIAEAMVRWLAPILSFTAEEIWQAMPGARCESVLFETWYEGLSGMPTDAALSESDFEQLLSIRACLSSVLEPMRKDGAVGSSLAARVALHIDTSSGLGAKLAVASPTTCAS
jgi:isoleucyl-tRNA synthetase